MKSNLEMVSLQNVSYLEIFKKKIGFSKFTELSFVSNDCHCVSAITAQSKKYEFFQLTVIQVFEISSENFVADHDNIHLLEMYQ